MLTNSLDIAPAAAIYGALGTPRAVARTPSPSSTCAAATTIAPGAGAHLLSADELTESASNCITGAERKVRQPRARCPRDEMQVGGGRQPAARGRVIADSPGRGTIIGTVSR